MLHCCAICYIMLRYVILLSYVTVLYCVPTLCYVMFWHIVILCYVTLRNMMLHYVILRSFYVMSCYVM